MNDNCIKSGHYPKISFPNSLKINYLNNGMAFMLFME